MIESQKSKVKSQNYNLKVKTFYFLLVVLPFYFLLLPFCHAQGEKFFEIRAKKFSYAPNIIKIQKGDVVRMRLVSEDVHHGFFLDGYGAKMSAYPGQEGEVKFLADKNGRFSFRCSVTCGEFHPYMVGYLIVEPNSRFFIYAFLTLIIGVGSIVVIARRPEGPTKQSNG